MTRILTPILLLVISMAACSSSASKPAAEPAAADTTTIITQDMAETTDTASVLVEMKTTEGDVVIKLYGDTPLHRDNFKRLASQGYYDGLLFHRVIKDFMVQAGDPDSKDAPAGKHLGSGNPGYTIPAEIVYPRHFHKRGALAAARTGDQTNPERRSSGSQFYIVTGRKYPAAQLQAMAEQSAMQTAMQNYFSSLVRAHRDEIVQMQEAGDSIGLQMLQQSLQQQTMEWAQQHPDKVTLPAEILDAYVQQGGTPHLDNQYTVFGEVVSGMDVIDRIQGVATDAADRPVEDVKIISMKVLDD